MGVDTDVHHQSSYTDALNRLTGSSKESVCAIRAMFKGANSNYPIIRMLSARCFIKQIIRPRNNSPLIK